MRITIDIDDEELIQQKRTIPDALRTLADMAEMPELEFDFAGYRKPIHRGDGRIIASYSVDMEE